MCPVQLRTFGNIVFKFAQVAQTHHMLRDFKMPLYPDKRCHFTAANRITAITLAAAFANSVSNQAEPTSRDGLIPSDCNLD